MKTDEPHGTIFLTRLPAAALAVALLGAGLPALAEQEPDPAGPQQVWLISTRHVFLGARQANDGPRLDVRLRSPDGTWLKSDSEAFLATDQPGVPTCFFIHGNRETWHSAIQTGMTTYRRLVGAGACQTDQPLRFVIWSWPADRVCRNNRSDLQLKASRSDREAYLLAGFIDRVQPHVPVTLVGYSFGARTVTGALHILGGGRVAGRMLGERIEDDRLPLRAVLVAAAENNDWLLPGHSNGLALGQSEAMLVTRNACDPVLRHYPRLYGRGGPEALGFTGPAAASRLGDERRKLELLGVDCSVGKDHSWNAYLCSSSLRAKMAEYVFAAATEGVTEAKGPTLPAESEVQLAGSN